MNIFRVSNRKNSKLKKPCQLFVISAFVFVMLAGNAFKLHSQISQTLFFMDRLPQSSLLNPAYQHAHSFHIGLSAISSFNVNAKTSFVSFNDMFFKHSGQDSLISFLHPDADTDDFISKLRKRNIVSTDLHLNLLSFGIRVDRHFFSFNISERASLRATLPGDLLLTALRGNEQFVGKTADFSDIGADLNYFREFAAGYSFSVDEKLNVGGRAKLLFGKANISFSDTDITLYTDPENYNMRLKSDITMNFSMPVTLIKDQDGNISDVSPHFDQDDYNPLDFVFNTGNAGFAVDLGATYRIIEPVTLYASITDLGFISWKSDVYNFSVDGEYEFDGIDLSSAFDYADDSDPAGNLMDSLSNIFGISDSRNGYRRGLPARLFLGGSYDLHPLVSVGLLSRSEIYQGRLEQAVTLSANSNIGRWLSASVSYSMMNNSYNNFGMGISLRGGGFQFYVISDNLASSFMPGRTRSANIWFGLNLVFGHRKSKYSEASELRNFDVPISDPS